MTYSNKIREWLGSVHFLKNLKKTAIAGAIATFFTPSLMVAEESPRTFSSPAGLEQVLRQEVSEWGDWLKPFVETSTVTQSDDTISFNFTTDDEAGANFNSTNKDITFECNESFKECASLIPAVHHELGHFVYEVILRNPDYDGPSIETIDKINAKRMQAPDMAKIRAEIKLMQRYREIDANLLRSVTDRDKARTNCTYLAMGVGAYDSLQRNMFSRDVLAARALSHYAKVLEKERRAYDQCDTFWSEISTNPARRIYDLRVKLPKRPHEDIEAAENATKKIEREMEELQKKLAMYTKTTTIAHSLKYKGLVEDMTDLFESKDCRDNSDCFWKARKFRDISMSYFEQSLNSMLSGFGTIVTNYRVVEGAHDSRPEEQFAAMLQTLFMPYFGEPQSEPLLIPLSNEQLAMFEQMRFKGKPMFKDQVARYRKMRGLANERKLPLTVVNEASNLTRYLRY